MGQATSGAVLHGSDAAAPQGRAPDVSSPVRASERLLAWVDARRWWLFGFILIVYLIGFTGVYHPEPDSALYMAIGRNLAEGRGFTYQQQVNNLAYPGYPWLLEGLYKTFGTGSLFAEHAAMLLITWATLAMTYLLLRLHASRPMAVLVTVNLALAEEMYAHAFQLRNDMPFLLGAMTFLAGYEMLVRRAKARTAASAATTGTETVPAHPARRSRAGEAAIAWGFMLAGMGIAVTMRPTMWALVAALVLGTIWTFASRHGRIRKRHVAAVAIVVATVALFYVLDPRRTGIEGTYEQTIGGVLSAPGETVRRVLTFHTLESFFSACSEAMYGHELGRNVDWLLMGWLIPAMLMATYRRPVWFFFLAGNLIMLLGMAQLSRPNYPGVLGQLVARHFLGLLPLLLYAGWIVALSIERWLPPRYARFMIALTLVIAFVPNLLKVAETAYRQRAYAAAYAIGNSETNAYEALGRVLPLQVSPGATLLAPRKQARIITYFSGLKVIDAAPTLNLKTVQGPLYILDRNRDGAADRDGGEPGIQKLIEREALELGPVLLTVKGGTEWRGKPEPDWTLRKVLNR